MMTGADIVGALLRGTDAITAKISAEEIRGGRLPENAPLPALLVRTIGSVDRHRLKGGAMIRTDDRVRVTVRARSYAEQLVVIGLLASIRVDNMPALAGAENVTVLTAGRGPDLDGPGNSFEQAQDYRVGFDRPAQPGD